MAIKKGDGKKILPRTEYFVYDTVNKTYDEGYNQKAGHGYTMKHAAVKRTEGYNIGKNKGRYVVHEVTFTPTETKEIQ